MKIRGFLKLFRLPNLPTAPGDALAGAAFVASAAMNNSNLRISAIVSPWALITVVGVALAALFLYMFGLADNDIVGVKEDIENASPRPIPMGELTLRQAKFARAICLIVAALIGVVSMLQWQWWVGGIGIVVCVLFYNRFKSKCKPIGLLAMGLCRSMSLLAGALAMYGCLLQSAGDFDFPLEIVFLMLGWTGYIAAVTYLAYDEHKAKAGLGLHYFFIGLVCLLPILGVLRFGIFFSILPILVCVYMFIRWILVLLPLRKEHTPSDRRKAVGQTIAALIYLQMGFALMPRVGIYYIPMVVCFIASYMIQKSRARTISGS